MPSYLYIAVPWELEPWGYKQGYPRHDAEKVTRHNQKTPENAESEYISHPTPRPLILKMGQRYIK